MNEKSITLTWYTYADHFREMLKNVSVSNEFTDITLVSEDKKHFKAHKIVLSASSPVFESIISDSTLSSLNIYFQGIQSLVLESILQFIYLGETKVYQDGITEFLTFAKSLEIKDICKEIYHENVVNQEFEEEDDSTVPKNKPEQLQGNNPLKQRQHFEKDH